jgi:hypothetical protein
MALVYRMRADKKYFDALIDRYWRQRPVFLRPQVQHSILAMVVAAAWVLAPWHGVDYVYVVTFAFVLALAVGPGGYYLTRSLILSRFRGKKLIGENVIYTLNDDNLHFEGPQRSATVRWPAYSKAVRYADGMLLLRPGVACWLPDSALSGGDRETATAFVASRTALASVA